MKQAIVVYLSLFILLVGGFSSCKDDDKKITPTPDINAGKGVFVVNEGTFMMGNASLYYLNFENDSLNTNTDLFKLKNNRPLGDVFQSMSLINDNAWLVLNNSSKIEVIDTKTSASIATIKNIKSPRYALAVSPNKVYVSDIYANSIHIINPTNYTKTGEIKCPGWTEELILFKNKVWVTNFTSLYLYAIDPTTDIITDSIAVPYGGSSIVADKNDILWVLCSGDAQKKKTGGLIGINANTLKIEQQWLFDSHEFNPIKLEQNVNQDSLYFISNGVYGFAKNANKLPALPFISQGSGSSFYGLTVNANNGTVVVSDAVDFVSQGKVSVYSPKGILLKSYKVGVNPSGFLWW